MLNAHFQNLLIGAALTRYLWCQWGGKTTSKTKWNMQMVSRNLKSTRMVVLTIKRCKFILFPTHGNKFHFSHCSEIIYVYRRVFFSYFPNTSPSTRNIHLGRKAFGILYHTRKRETMGLFSITLIICHKMKSSCWQVWMSSCSGRAGCPEESWLMGSRQERDLNVIFSLWIERKGWWDFLAKLPTINSIAIMQK